ncbi:MAG: efflux RND transporter periplasmic adaptor subunit [Bryobacterales bacterium]|nr:efflux RND transporter periplasmic adaptor subunit [Bryobacterales bacterium]
MKFPAFLLFSLIFVGCGGHEEPAKKQAAATPMAVTTVTAAASEWPTSREAVGTVRARVSGSVSSRIMAYVREVRVNQGDSVRAGQLLITLDSKDLETSVRQAEEAQREARSAEAEVESAIRAARAQLDLAEVTFKRMKDLFDKKSISHQEFDEAQARLQLARANHDMAVSRRKQLEAKIEQEAAAVRNASIMRGYSEITAPFGGVVTEKRVEPGNLATPGAPLLIIEQAGLYRLEVPVDESLLPSLRRGQRVEVVLEALDRTLQAPIAEIVPSVDPATRSVTVKLDLPGQTGLRTGMSGRARFPGAASKVLAAPASAVRQQGSLQFVFVADQGRARGRLVTTGEHRGDMVQILSGLSEGDAYIHPLPPTLADGAPVEVSR